MPGDESELGGALGGATGKNPVVYPPTRLESNVKYIIDSLHSLGENALEAGSELISPFTSYGEAVGKAFGRQSGIDVGAPEQ